MNEKKLMLFEISERLDVISWEMKENFPGLVGALILQMYAAELEELAKEMNRLLS